MSVPVHGRFMLLVVQQQPPRAAVTPSVGSRLFRTVAEAARQHRSWVPLALAASHALDRFSNLQFVLFTQLHIDSCHILFQILDTFRSRDL